MYDQQPIYAILSLVFVVIIKSITAFVGFMLIGFLILPLGPLETSAEAVVHELEEALPAVKPVIDAVETVVASAAEPAEETTGVPEQPELVSFESYEDPDGCRLPDDNYEMVEVNGWQINSRTYSMLEYAQELYGEDIQLTGANLIHGSYDDRDVMADTPFSGGGAVGISVMDVNTGEVLTTDLQGLITDLRTAGFAAWLRGVDEVYPGSPMMIEAIAVGDRDLNERASLKLFSDYGYFSLSNGLPGDAYKADSHGGPVVCRWMLEAGYGGAAVEAEAAAVVGSTFEEENHAAMLDPESVNRDARQLRIVPEPLAFQLADYTGPASFNCTAPADSSVVSGVFGEQRGEFIHAGIDFAQCSRVGYAVYTPMGGQVTYAEYHELYGYTVVIENDGWQVIFAHNLADLVSVGDIVEAGQVVALSGSSGNSGGPHIHFEVRNCEDGQCRPVNPGEVLLPGQSEICEWEELGQLECPPGF